MMKMNREAFLQLPAAGVAKLVRAAGPQVCVFPINGTRRWFALEHTLDPADDAFEKYLDISIRKHVELCSLIFDHGIDTLLTPVFGSELLTRGNEYARKVGINGLVRTAGDPAFLEFFKNYKVRVRFYGDYRKHLASTSFAHALESLDKVTELTKNNTSFNLFFGVFADDATQTLAELSIRHFQKEGNIPSRRQLVEQYYGEYIEPASLFIGFDKFSVFDYPMLNVGNEDLYFSISPSPYMTEKQLRLILYDHTFERKNAEPDYASLSQSELQNLREYYRLHQDEALGVGEIKEGLWTPSFIADKDKP